MIRLIEEKKVDGKSLKCYLLESENGIRAEIINYGARIHKLFVKNKNGEYIDVVAGFNDIEGYLGDNPYFNATIGRVANRIAYSKFSLNGKEYNLYNNDGKHHLHGGKEGFDRKIWDGEIITENGLQKLQFSYLSPDGEENYPGNLKVIVKYSIVDGDTLTIEYYAETDGDTMCSLTNHAYFNLSGDFNNTILNHIVRINGVGVSAIDDNLIPDGSVIKTAGSPFDFSTPTKIGKNINSNDRIIKSCQGFDVNYLLANDYVNPVAEAYCEESGVCMQVFTDKDNMQLYTGNMLDGLKGKATFNQHTAFCMETQEIPNSLNTMANHKMLLKAGESCTSKTSYKFFVK